MAAATEVPSSLEEHFAKEAEKMMNLKLSQLKKVAKKHGIEDEAIQRVTVAGADEYDTKNVIIRLIFKSACVKAAPTPSRTRVEAPEEDCGAQMCMKCKGCIRPPGHEGPCMDGLLNDIVPESECVKMAAEELERHKALKQEIQRKIEEAARLQAASEEEARRKVAKEFRRQAEAEARKKAAEEEARRKAAEEEIRRKTAEDEARRQAEARQKLEEEEARRQFAEMQKAMARKIAEEEELAKRKAEEEARKIAEEEEARREAVEAAKRQVEEEARKKAAEEAEARKKAEEDARRAEDAAEMAEMDQRCVDTFLECLKCSRIRTPLKGTILYTKFIRPCRPPGTSVDVKDSSFRNLGNYLKFLEEEGLLCLQPGLTDPVVTEIRHHACRNYKYVARPVATQPLVVEEARVGSGFASTLGKLLWQ